MKEYIEILKKSPLFYNIDENDISSILTCLSSNEKTYRKDEYVWTAENKITEVGIVLTGSVNIIKEDYWGNRAIISKITSGKMFGEAFSCSKLNKLPISVVTSEITKILFINYKKIITVCSNTCIFHANLIDNMLKILADNNIMLIQKMEHLVKKSTRQKILSFLSEQAEKSNNNSFIINFNRQELADYLSVDRSAMSNEICKLRDEGILLFNKNQFTLVEKTNKSQSL
ncbi:MAG: Crp/Fnr family transcriptional regulator [Endomicrobiia bacterium]|nr:Crp/Fnr family transcriptional regulator [Endomicrobiaceae bacterium]MDD3921983.1 Crp/Fnr family transcriptional regulator [Endomicrobiaceae bacterium]